jgi:hypothetical protein
MNAFHFGERLDVAVSNLPSVNVYEPPRVNAGVSA